MFFFWIVMILVSLFAQYWILRLAVRGGVEDAERRRLAKIAELQFWDEVEAKRRAADAD